MGLVLTDVLGFGGDLARVGHTRLGAGAQHGTLDMMTDAWCSSGTFGVLSGRADLGIRTG
jgi:hypothetical protein